MNRIHLSIILIIFSYNSLCLSDYLSQEQIAPGVRYFHDYRSSGPWHIHILEVDLLNSDIDIKSAKANNSLFARRKTSVISDKLNYEKQYSAGAINADFFESNGTPVGAQVIDGLLINEPTPRSVFGMTVDNEPFIDVVNWKGKLLFKQKFVAEIGGLNRQRITNDWFIFNSYYTKDTLSVLGGTFIQADLVSNNLAINDTLEYKISKIRNSEDVVLRPADMLDSEIIVICPPKKIRISEVGNKLQLLLNLPPLDDKIDLLVGGLPRLIRDGSTAIDWKKENIRESFSTNRHPRTAVGYTKDKNRVLFFVVDGRQPGYSMGMSLNELADYMLEWGIYQGVNLDGGGSSTMVIQGEVANSPSDPNGERAVANVLAVVNKKEKNAIKKLNIIPDEISLIPGQNFQFEVNFQDNNYHPFQNPIDSVKWFCRSDLGDIDSTGFFTADSLATTGFLYVQNGALIDSAKISIIDEMQKDK